VKEKAVLRIQDDLLFPQMRGSTEGGRFSSRILGPAEVLSRRAQLPGRKSRSLSEALLRVGVSNPTIMKRWRNQAVRKDTKDSAAGPVVGVLLSLTGSRQRAALDTSPSVFTPRHPVPESVGPLAGYLPAVNKGSEEDTIGMRYRGR
jgi:hypothetical protein